MKKKFEDLAIFGGKPIFKKDTEIKQQNLPSWEEFHSQFSEIFDRRYYTNHGPLTHAFETEIESTLGVRNAISMTNSSIGMIIAAKSLGLKGKVIAPAFMSQHIIQPLIWAGLEPVLCDVNENTHMLSVREVEPLIDDTVGGVLGCHMWGNSCYTESLSALCKQHELPLFFDAGDSYGGSCNNLNIGVFGDLEVFSFGVSSVLNCAGGGMVCTNNDDLAAIARNIRSSYGAGYPVPIPLTGNGRFSEAQAAMGLMALEKIDEIIQVCKHQHDLYHSLVGDIPGVQIINAIEGQESNNQNLVVRVDEAACGVSRDILLLILKNENISSPNMNCYGNGSLDGANNKFPITDILSRCLIMLPVGLHVTDNDIIDICSVLMASSRNSSKIRMECKL